MFCAKSDANIQGINHHFSKLNGKKVKIDIWEKNKFYELKN